MGWYAKFVPLVERHHGADNEHAAGVIVEMRPRADFAPGVRAGII